MGQSEDNDKKSWYRAAFDAATGLIFGEEAPSSSVTADTQPALADTFNSNNSYEPFPGRTLFVDPGDGNIYSFANAREKNVALDVLADKRIPMAVSFPLLYASMRSPFPMEFLKRLAFTESSYRPDILNGDSGAGGLMQITEGPHLQWLYQYGEKHGYGDLAAGVERIKHKNSSGEIVFEYVIKEGVDVNTIMDIRLDPRYSTLIALENLQGRLVHLQESLDRPVNFTEAYMVHMLGLKGALRFIEHLHAKPNSPVLVKDGNPDNDALSWYAYNDNPGIFKDDNGRARSIADVYNILKAKMGEETLPDMKGQAVEPTHHEPRTELASSIDTPKP